MRTPDRVPPARLSDQNRYREARLHNGDVGIVEAEHPIEGGLVKERAPLLLTVCGRDGAQV